MTVVVRLFAVLRERAGRDRVELELAEGATVADALAALARAPGAGGLLERPPGPAGRQPRLRTPTRRSCAPTTSWP